MKKCLLLMVIFVLFQTPVYAGDTSNLEAAYLMDESSGTRFDETDNNNDLTDNNTVGFNASCQFNGCADFENSNSESLSITDASQTGLDFTGDYTILCWVNVEGFPATANAIYAQWSTTGILLRIRATLVDFFHDSNNATVSTSISTATWTHITFQHDDSADQVEFFKDGTSAGTASQTTNLQNTSHLIEIGINAGGTGHDGLMDELAIFSRVLTGSEITDIKDNGIEAFRGGVSRRIIMIAFITHNFSGIYNEYARYFNLVVNHRQKFGIHTPMWMKVIGESYEKN